MGIINCNKLGLVIGAVGGGWHLLWAILVAAGSAQPLLNFVFWMHFLASPFVVQPFQLWVALLLVAITSLIGYATGYILGAVLNGVHRQSHQQTD